jgi:hypothetical protein
MGLGTLSSCAAKGDTGLRGWDRGEIWIRKGKGEDTTETRETTLILGVWGEESTGFSAALCT